ncbi:hypothetical protein HMI54_011508 [Coelomomyces lativittatus]|nr:hypothetical protein HMI54_011508 [Coelomomyces lativittatus]
MPTYSTNPNLFNSQSWSPSSQWNDLSKGNIYTSVYTHNKKVKLTKPQVGSFSNTKIDSISHSQPASTPSNTKEIPREISPLIKEAQLIFESTQKGKALLEILETFGKNVAVYSPMGFMQLFSLLYLAADLESNSKKELARFVMSKDQMELINSLKTSIEEYKAKNVLIANAYAAKGIPIAPTLVQHLQQSNTKLLKDQQAINTFIKEGTQGLLKGLKIQLNDHSILLVNLISLKLKWLRSAALEEKEMAFTFRDPKKPKAMTPFAIHNLKNVPYFDKGGIKACTIPFMDEKGATNPSLNSLSAYIIQHDQGSLSMDKFSYPGFESVEKSN